MAFHITGKHEHKTHASDNGNAQGYFSAHGSATKGSYAPDFGVELIDGSSFTLSDHIGNKIIIINFFATWCGPCKSEMPELTKFHDLHRGDPFILLGIDARESEDKVWDFIDEFEVEFPVAIDRGKLLGSYGIVGFPTTVFIGADGKIQLYESGAVMNAEAAFGRLYKQNMDVIVAGKGIDKATYLKALKK